MEVKELIDGLSKLNVSNKDEKYEAKFIGSYSWIKPKNLCIPGYAVLFFKIFNPN